MIKILFAVLLFFPTKAYAHVNDNCLDVAKMALHSMISNPELEILNKDFVPIISEIITCLDEEPTTPMQLPVIRDADTAHEGEKTQ